jgi:hypothetical protein
MPLCCICSDVPRYAGYPHVRTPIKVFETQAQRIPATLSSAVSLSARRGTSAVSRVARPVRGLRFFMRS